MILDDDNGDDYLKKSNGAPQHRYKNDSCFTVHEKTGGFSDSSESYNSSHLTDKTLLLY